MKTADLISILQNDLKNPSDSKHWFTQYWFSWISCFSIFSILTYIAAAFLPEDIHLPTNLKNFTFWMESFMWFAMAFSSAVVAYLSSLPPEEEENPWFMRLAGVFAAILMVSLFDRWSFSAIASEWAIESEFLRGPCGIFIGVTGLFASFWMFYVIKRAMPLRLGFTAAWSTASVGCLASMFMHLVCAHESSVHIFVWHVVPLVSLILLLSAFSNRLLRW